MASQKDIMVIHREHDEVRDVAFQKKSFERMRTGRL